MSLKSKMFAACGLFVWIVIIVLGVSVYALNAVGDLAGNGESPQAIHEYTSRMTILILAIGVVGVCMTQIIIFVTVTATHRKLVLILDYVNESSHLLASAAQEKGEDLP